MLDRAAAVFMVTLLTFRDRAKAVRDNEGGFSTLEWVLLALGVFTAAGIAIAVIAAVINDRLAEIN